MADSTACVEAFSDGVFAIAITLLILEIRVPEEPGERRARFDMARRGAASEGLFRVTR